MSVAICGHTILWPAEVYEEAHLGQLPGAQRVQRVVQPSGAHGPMVLEMQVWPSYCPCPSPQVAILIHGPFFTH